MWQMKRGIRRKMKAYLKNSSVELEIRGFHNETNEHGAICLICECYAKAFDSVEEIPASRIEIR